MPIAGSCGQGKSGVGPQASQAARGRRQRRHGCDLPSRVRGGRLVTGPDTIGACSRLLLWPRTEAETLEEVALAGWSRCQASARSGDAFCLVPCMTGADSRTGEGSRWVKCRTPSGPFGCPPGELSRSAFRPSRDLSAPTVPARPPHRRRRSGTRRVAEPYPCPCPCPCRRSEAAGRGRRIPVLVPASSSPGMPAARRAAPVGPRRPEPTPRRCTTPWPRRPDQGRGTGRAARPSALAGDGVVPATGPAPGPSDRGRGPGRRGAPTVTCSTSSRHADQSVSCGHPGAPTPGAYRSNLPVLPPRPYPHPLATQAAWRPRDESDSDSVGPGRPPGRRATATAEPGGPPGIRSPIPVPPLSRPVPRRRTPTEG